MSRKIETNAKVLIGSCLCLLAGKCRKFGKPQLYTGAKKKKRNKKLKTHRKVGGGKRESRHMTKTSFHFGLQPGKSDTTMP